MSGAASFAHQAEILKLARLFNLGEDRLAFLRSLDPATIRQLRETATAALFDSDQHIFQRLAAATRLLPGKVSALIAEKALGALICARIAGLLPPERAVDVARRLHTPFLADVCLELDPRHVRELIAMMPVDRVVEVARELARRQEYITMARFVDSLGETAMRAILDALTDDAALLRVGFFVEDPAQLDAVVAMLPPARLGHMIRIAVTGPAELWPEALALLQAIGESQRRRMAEQAAGLDDDVIGLMIERTQSQDLWAQLVPVVALIRRDQQQRLMRMPQIDRTVLESIVRSAEDLQDDPGLPELLAQLDEALLREARALVTAQNPTLADRLDAVIAAAVTAGPAAAR